MRIHKEGKKLVIFLLLLFLVINIIIEFFVPIQQKLQTSIIALSVFTLGFVMYFFRHPHRITTVDEQTVIAPADGTVVVIEEVMENEYFKDKRIQVSIFMSPANVHVNRVPISGEIPYIKYHSGKFLVAWHPKSSEENERNTVVIKNDNNEILLRQIAGVLARRIVNYLKVEDKVTQGDEFGFIKFGSRVDVFLPLNANIEVDLNDKVKGGQTIIATLEEEV
ncbi:MAG: phosphatidylserine decarboxylase family protein [Chitinophagaceae bacterium]|nr:MAG: phosphatidylserine decarboxylase family protein [Chitinophagaceae bacterium]